MKKQVMTAGAAGARVVGKGKYAPKFDEKQVTEVGDLQDGQVVLASARLASTDDQKAVLEFAEGIARPDQTINVLAEANEGDDRFNNSISVRRAWLTASLDNLKSKFGISDEKIEEIKGGEIVELMIENPVMLDRNGNEHKLCLQIDHSIRPYSEFQAENPEKAARQFPRKNGPTLYPCVRDAKGVAMPTFERIQVVTASDRKHSIIISKPEDRLTWEELQSNGVQNVGASYAINR